MVRKELYIGDFDNFYVIVHRFSQDEEPYDIDEDCIIDKHQDRLGEVRIIATPCSDEDLYDIDEVIVMKPLCIPPFFDETDLEPLFKVTKDTTDLVIVFDGEVSESLAEYLLNKARSGHKFKVIAEIDFSRDDIQKLSARELTELINR